MIFDNFGEGLSFLLWSAFAIAFIMGIVANKTNFCTMGAISDWVNMGDLGRMRAWFFAIAIAILGVVILEFMGFVNPDQAFPPYRGSTLVWGENIIGGLLFGIGMTLGSGCGNKTLVRIGGGNIKSIFVLLIIAVTAYFMLNPIPGTNKTLYSELFFWWTRAIDDTGDFLSPLTIALTSRQDLGSLIGAKDNAVNIRLGLGLILALGIIVIVWKSKEFRRSLDNILAGTIIGLCIIAAWYISSNISISSDDEIHSLLNYRANWDFLAESNEAKTAGVMPLSPQSYTFINPMGQAFAYVLNGFSSAYVTFGVMAVIGVITGSFFWSMISRGFRIEWFASFKDFLNHLIGAVLMGLGGTLAVGCTIGQGITGVSSLSLGSFLALGGIILGCALTMKVQYYKLVYEDDATFIKALVTGLVDLKLLPASMRQLDAL